VWPDLASLPAVTVHRVPRPLGAHLLGAPLLSLAASWTAGRLGPSARLLSNGGNTRWIAPTWVHYLHAAYTPHVAAGARARLTTAMGRRRNLEREAETITRAPTVICNSHRTAADVRTAYAVAAARVHVVYYGVDPEQFSEVTTDARRAARRTLDMQPEPPAAVFIGALGDRRKGFDVLFDAWQLLCADPAWDVNLMVVGVGAEAGAWESRAAAAGLSRRLSFLRFRPDVPLILAAADVMVHPSRYEAYGLGVHEALCRGLPAIVSASAGVAERLPEDLRPLTLPDPLRPDDLVARLRSWRRDMPAWRTRARAAGEVLRRRTWDHMAADIAGIVEAT
jgi:glycosyltransferase involved in cell wall biosynthesis